MNTNQNQVDLSTFRQRLLNREKMVGTFQKTPSSMVSEVLGLTELDAVCLDAEHCPFGRMELDSCIFALRASNMPSLVRVPCSSESEILNALDCGATGIIAPHICSAEDARKIAKAAHFGRGGRGYAGSTRAAAYTTKKMPEHMTDSAASTTVIIQIEDVEAVEVIEEIAAVDGIDCLFIGRIDLTVALGAKTPKDPNVIEAVQKVCTAAKQVQKPVGMFVGDHAEIPGWIELGASFFLLASDHNFILSGAEKLSSIKNWT